MIPWLPSKIVKINFTINQSLYICAIVFNVACRGDLYPSNYHLMIFYQMITLKPRSIKSRHKDRCLLNVHCLQRSLGQIELGYVMQAINNPKWIYKWYL